MKTATLCYHYSSDDLGAGMRFSFPTQQRLMGNKIPFINDTSLSVIPAAKHKVCMCIRGCEWVHPLNTHTHTLPVLSAPLSSVNLQCLSYLSRWVKAGRASSGATRTLCPPPSTPSIFSSFAPLVYHVWEAWEGGRDKNEPWQEAVRQNG